MMAEQTVKSNSEGIDELDCNSALPLYYQLKELIKKKINENVWQRDQMIPSENEIAAAYGVSVGTVKKAYGELVHEGLLYRRQGKGTFIARPDFRRSFIRFFRYGSGPEVEGITPGSRVLGASVMAPGPRVKEALKLDKGDSVIVIKRLRTLHDVPFMLEDLYLPESIFKGFQDQDISQALLYPIYDAQYQAPIIWADEFLEPRIAGSEEATHLGISPGDPVIYLERIAYTLGDKPVEFRTSTGRGDRFRYHIELR